MRLARRHSTVGLLPGPARRARSDAGSPSEKNLPRS